MGARCVPKRAAQARLRGRSVDAVDRRARDGAPFCADITAMDLLVAPSIGFVQLYVLVIVRLERRKLVCINVTPHLTAEWIARQVRGIPLGSSPALPDPQSVNVREV